ncbi:hypothetical protein [Mycolicibacterium chlorophenolicum]|uniref:hypothetical protein n=1 Tax=Mycolicibacterium chlorophenolicum TaxID=37916 RepID=UPI000ADBB2FE|nr:hypothetical protein [Mycolicibacterium chlorophenolicum]
MTEQDWSGRPEDDDRLGALDRSRGLDVTRLRCVHARIDYRRCAQNMASTVPATLAVRGTAKGWAIDVHLHVSESNQGS